MLRAGLPAPPPGPSTSRDSRGGSSAKNWARRAGAHLIGLKTFADADRREPPGRHNGTTRWAPEEEGMGGGRVVKGLTVAQKRRQYTERAEQRGREGGTGGR